MHKGGKLRKLEVRVLKDMHLQHCFIIQIINQRGVTNMIDFFVEGHTSSSLLHHPKRALTCVFWFVRTKDKDAKDKVDQY